MGRLQYRHRKTKYSTLTPEEFVVAWQESKSVKDFCQVTGMKERSASVRASSYRKKGIRLKKMPTGSSGGRPKLDIEMLDAIAVTTGTLDDKPTND